MYIVGWLILSVVATAFFCFGAILAGRKAELWRMEWVKLEHELAKLQNRAPRNSVDVEEEW